jgi:hypothetical protein
MNIEDRRQKARAECYTIEEIVDFFLQFYDIGYEYDKDIILKKTLNLYKSDISIRLSSFIRPNTSNDRLVHEIILSTFSTYENKNGIHSQKYLHLEYTCQYNDLDNYYWFIVDRYESSYVLIKKEDILMSMVDFIIENESKGYKPPVQLKDN